MMRLAIPLVLGAAAACGGKAKHDTGAGSGSAPALYAKKLSVAWTIQPTGDKSDVFLAATDETGSAVSYPLGSYDGLCTVIKPAPEMQAVTGVRCANAELDVVANPDAVIVLKLRLEPGVTPDPMAREEVTRIKAPPGAKVEVGT